MTAALFLVAIASFFLWAFVGASDIFFLITLFSTIGFVFSLEYKFVHWGDKNRPLK